MPVNRERFLIVLIFIILMVNFAINTVVYAQTTDKQSIPLDWNQILTLIGVSGLVSGAGGVLFKLAGDLVQSKGERRRRAIELKVGLYATLIFDLERMMENPDFTSGSGHPESPTKIIQTRDEIDNLLKEKYYLVDAKSVSNWLYFRNHWEDLEFSLATDLQEKKKAQKVIDKVIDLRNDLVGKYNSDLRTEYKKRTSIQIEEIKPPQRSRLVLK